MKTLWKSLTNKVTLLLFGTIKGVRGTFQCFCNRGKFAKTRLQNSQGNASGIICDSLCSHNSTSSLKTIPHCWHLNKSPWSLSLCFSISFLLPKNSYTWSMFLSLLCGCFLDHLNWMRLSCSEHFQYAASDLINRTINCWFQKGQVTSSVKGSMAFLVLIVVVSPSFCLTVTSRCFVSTWLLWLSRFIVLYWQEVHLSTFVIRCFCLFHHWILHNNFVWNLRNHIQRPGFRIRRHISQQMLYMLNI